MNKTIITLCILLGFSNLSSQPVQWAYPATTLSTSGVNASTPAIAMDSSGDLVAVWVESNYVKAKTKLESGSWSSATTLSATGASSPRVVTDSNGNSTAIWIVSGVVYASSKTLSGSWSSSTTLSSSGASSPVLAVDAAGDVIAAWVTSTSVQTSTKLYGNSWQTHVSISTTAPANLQLSIGGTGSATTAALVWHEAASSINVVYTATKLISGSWSTPLALSNANVNSAYAQVAVDPNANVSAIWYQYDVTGTSYTNVVVQSSSRLSNATWTTPINLSQPGIRNPANLTSGLAFDGVGNAVAVWTTSFDDENIHVQSSSKNLNGTWSSPVDIVDGNLYSYSESLSVSKFGDVLTTFMFYNGAALMIQAAESDISGFVDNLWSVPVNISQGTDNGYPMVVSTASGNSIYAAAVWLNYNGTNTSMQVTTGTKSLPLPPSSPTVTQSSNNFGVFTEYYNTLSWTASSSPSVTGYVIYRNGEYLQQVPASVLEIIDDNRVETGAVTYGVAAIDSQNTHSQIISVTYE